MSHKTPRKYKCEPRTVQKRQIEDKHPDIA